MLSHIAFISIPVIDPDRARDFYAARLGLSVTVDVHFGDERWIMLAIPGARTQLRLHPVDAMPERGRPTLPIIVDELEPVLTRLREAGAEIVAQPRPAEWKPDVDYALVRDSEGSTILLATG